MYVDDERGNRVVFEQSLAADFNLKVAADAATALTLMEQHEVAVLVTDMPLADHPGPSWFVTLVIGGSIATELLLQRAGAVAADARSDPEPGVATDGTPAAAATDEVPPHRVSEP